MGLWTVVVAMRFQMNEFRSGATKQNMETTHLKEETKRLRSQLGELRDKLADLDAKV